MQKGYLMKISFPLISSLHCCQPQRHHCYQLLECPLKAAGRVQEFKRACFYTRGSITDIYSAASFSAKILCRTQFHSVAYKPAFGRGAFNVLYIELYAIIYKYTISVSSTLFIDLYVMSRLAGKSNPLVSTCVFAYVEV